MSPTSSASHPSSSSSPRNRQKQDARILGGGKAAMSAEVESLIVRLLRVVREDGVQNNKDQHEHEAERADRKFLKVLVENNRRESLSSRVNDIASVRARDNIDDHGQGGSGGRSPSCLSGSINSTVAAVSEAKGKVRIELVEAIYTSADGGGGGKKKSSKKKDSSSSSKKKKTSSSSSSSPLWKAGSHRKLMVLPRSTTAKELLLLSKSKLRMSKKPLRCFVVISEVCTISGLGSKGMGEEVDLHCDLRGVDDGATIYVTSTSSSGSGTNAGNGEDGGGYENESGCPRTPDRDNFVNKDPLDAVKAVYRRNRQRKQQDQSQQRAAGRKQQSIDSSSNEGVQQQLPPISKERADLPAAAYRDRVLLALDETRVLIVSGSTGCGKSTQIPQYILEGSGHRTKRDEANIIVTQPRRVAAISLADRVATERSSPNPGKMGCVVGYQVRLARAVSPDGYSTRIVFCTVGILLRRLIDSFGGDAASSHANHASAPQEGKEEDGQSGGNTLDDVISAMKQTSADEFEESILPSVSHVIIDEVHERDVNTDFVLILLRAALKKNKRLKIVLMSATGDVDLFVKYFTIPSLGIAPALITIPGRIHPVETFFLKNCENFAGVQMMGGDVGADKKKDNEMERSAMKNICDEKDQKDYDGSSENAGQAMLLPRSMSRIDNAFICRLIRAIIDKKQEKVPTTNETIAKMKPNNHWEKKNKMDGTGSAGAGAMLVFLPGKGEIDSLAAAIDKDYSLKNRCLVLVLHSNVPPAQQRKAFLLPPSNKTKIVLATNIAETSITIPDVSIVIDTGREKESRYNPNTRIKELVTVWTSRASATQRMGRAGRTRAGTCWRLYPEDFYEQCMPERTVPEMMRTPLDELVLHACLLGEQKHDRQVAAATTAKTENGVERTSLSVSAITRGYSPARFLGMAPNPPPMRRIHHACQHLMEVGAICRQQFIPSSKARQDSDEPMFRLTPLGYHLSYLPMDVKVGKILIVGCILGCLQPALTIAAALSSPKSIFLRPRPTYTGAGPARSGSDLKERQNSQRRLVEEGFGCGVGGRGPVRGDLTAVVSAYKAWSDRKTDRERRQFAIDHSLDHYSLRDLYSLRAQFHDCLVEAGLVGPEKNMTKNVSFHNDEGSPSSSFSHDDALLTSCCLVAGLYPNIATLLRPRRGQRGGRLVTREGEICLPSSSSFQAERIRHASEDGRDAYVVYHAKHRTVGTSAVSAAGRGGQKQQNTSFLGEVNFVSRYALLLFGGNLKVRDNCLIMDGWLKFKIGTKGEVSAVLIQELRKEIDKVLLDRIVEGWSGDSAHDEGEGEHRQPGHSHKVVQVVTRLLEE